MISFTFNGRNSKDFGVYALALDRTLLPELNNYNITIPGKDGVYEVDTQTYKNRIIPVQLGLLGNYTEEELRTKSREVAYWLSQKGNLIFDDEPDKYYYGRIYNAVNFVQYGSNDYLSEGFNSATCDINFDLHPMAQSVPLYKISGIGNRNVSLTVNSSGNKETCGKIVIKNTGSTNITLVNIERKVVI